MIRIADVDHLRQEDNLVYGVLLLTEDEELIECDELVLAEAFFREIETIIVLGVYDEETNLPRIIYVVKDGNDHIHYYPHHTQPVKLKEFLDLLSTTPGNKIKAKYEILGEDAFVEYFELIPDPNRIDPPSMTVNATLEEIIIPFITDADNKDDDK